jgi:hypothetical protein
MRHEGWSLGRAARMIGIQPKRVRELVPSALRKNKRGRWTATKADTLLRVLTVPGPRGQREIVINDSRTASLIGQYLNAVRRHLHRGDATALKALRGLKLVDARGKPIVLITNLRKLDELGSAGLLTYESMYSRS